MRHAVLFGCLLILTSCSLPPQQQNSSLSASGTLHSLAPSAQMAESGTTLNLGKGSAPLTLLLFTNHACDYCRDAHDDLLPRLTTDFIQKGLLRLRIAILPIAKYPMSLPEASALFCANAQDRGWEMHGELFTLANHSLTSITAKAAKLQLNAKLFDGCMKSPEAAAYAQAQQTLADRYEVTLVPTFILESEKQVGLLTYADLRGWIETKLQEKGITQ